MTTGQVFLGVGMLLILVEDFEEKLRNSNSDIIESIM